MHLSPPRPLTALLVLATGLTLLLDAPLARAAGNPFEQIFGQKKTEEPPPKKNSLYRTPLQFP